MALNCVIGLKYGGAIMTGTMKKSNGGIQARYCNYILNLDGEGAAPTIRLRRRGLGIACFLRNTLPKSDFGACGKGASSFHVKSRPLMSSTRRRGASPGRALRADGSRNVKRFSAKRGARGSSIGADRTGRIRIPLKRNNVWRFKMKMVKSLLLGTAAGLVAIAGAQAADLPVKAKPVQYVKICSLYGAGFYYIPGTDTCIKIGGFVRAEVNVMAQGSFAVMSSGDFKSNSNGNLETWRSRAGVTFDTRTQTEYGTLRSYFIVATTSTNSQGGGGGAAN